MCYFTWFAFVWQLCRWRFWRTKMLLLIFLLYIATHVHFVGLLMQKIKKRQIIRRNVFFNIYYKYILHSKIVYSTVWPATVDCLVTNELTDSAEPADSHSHAWDMDGSRRGSWWCPLLNPLCFRLINKVSFQDRNTSFFVSRRFLSCLSMITIQEYDCRGSKLINKSEPWRSHSSLRTHTLKWVGRVNRHGHCPTSTPFLVARVTWPVVAEGAYKQVIIRFH